MDSREQARLDQQKQVLEEQTRRLAAETLRANEELKRIKAEEQARQNFERESAFRTQKVLDNAVDRYITNNYLNPETFQKYWEMTKTNQLLSPEDIGYKYFQTVVKMLSHKHYGVESSSVRIGNGGLTFRGETYKTPIDLYNAIQKIVGEDPFQQPSWFYEVLEDIFEDPTRLAYEVTNPNDYKARHMRMIELAFEVATFPVGVAEEDKDKHTAEDTLKLAVFFGQL